MSIGGRDTSLSIKRRFLRGYGDTYYLSSNSTYPQARSRSFSSIWVDVVELEVHKYIYILTNIFTVSEDDPFPVNLNASLKRLANFNELCPFFKCRLQTTSDVFLVYGRWDGRCWDGGDGRTKDAGTKLERR